MWYVGGGRKPASNDVQRITLHEDYDLIEKNAKIGPLPPRAVHLECVVELLV